MKKNILLLAEKNGLIEEFINTEVFKNFETQNNVNITYSFGITPYVFTYPKNIPYSNYPQIKNPEFKLINDKSNTYLEFYKDCMSIISEINYDEIIIICDYDHTGVFGANLVLSKNLYKNWKKNVNYYFIPVIRRDKIEKDFIKQVINKDLKSINKNKAIFEKLLLEGEIKRYFDFNYNLNSQVFFSEILKHINEKNNFHKETKNITITKFMLLTLFLISKLDNKIPNTNASVLRLMCDYKGSGKFEKNLFYGIGTPASTHYIFHNLIDLNLIEECGENTYKNKLYKISVIGETFLKLLNKKMFDPDIPFRLRKWMEMPKEEALEKINTYLNTQFSSQKRKNKYLKMI